MQCFNYTRDNIHLRKIKKMNLYILQKQLGIVSEKISFLSILVYSEMIVTIFTNFIVFSKF